MARNNMTALALRRMMDRNSWNADRVAELTVRDRRTVNRWLSGESNIPMIVVKHLRNLDGAE